MGRVVGTAGLGALMSGRAGPLRADGLAGSKEALLCRRRDRDPLHGHRQCWPECRRGWASERFCGADPRICILLSRCNHNQLTPVSQSKMLRLGPLALDCDVAGCAAERRCRPVGEAWPAAPRSPHCCVADAVGARSSVACRVLELRNRLCCSAGVLYTDGVVAAGGAAFKRVPARPICFTAGPALPHRPGFYSPEKAKGTPVSR